MKKDELEDSEWLSISDMMSGLMFIFLLIAVMYMREANNDIEELKRQSQELKQIKENIEQVSKNFDNIKEQISQALSTEFKDDLKIWNAEIIGTVVRFKSPKMLFSVGKSSLRKKFKTILSNFFPRYIKILKEFQVNIEEIRIEGHTSSKWNRWNSREQSYIKNAQLSQMRALEVLKYSISQTDVKNSFEWLVKVTRSNGLSFAKLILDKDGKEDFQSSRRVEFRVMTNIEVQLEKIKELLGKGN